MTITAKPILMNAEMVRATLREIKAPGTGKTQTRRIFKVRGPMGDSYPVTSPEESLIELTDNELRDHGTINYLSTGSLSGPYSCPYGKPGDLLYVRETYADFSQDVDFGQVLYRADTNLNPPYKWTPSIHMPRWASRITLQVTDVRVQRLRDISEKDAKAEGVYRDEDRPEEHDYRNNEWMCPQCAGTGLFTAYSWGGAMPDTDCYKCDTSKQKFHHLWTSINGPESWEANPWVWAVSFKPHLINVDRFIEERAAA